MNIIIPGDPIPKNRPRFTRKGRTYDDQTKVMKDIAILIRAQCDLTCPYRIPVKLNIIFFMPIPKSLSKKKQAELSGTPHYKRGDIDNYFKFSMDCLVNAGNVITDDAIIAEIHAYKIYSTDPRTEINITTF